MFEAAREKDIEEDDGNEEDGEPCEKEDRDFSKLELEFLESLKGHPWVFGTAIRVVRRRLDALMETGK